MQVIVISKQTFFERHLKNKHARLRADSAVYRRMLRTHESQKRTVETCHAALAALGIDPAYEHGVMHDEIEADLVITIGGDGTLLLASHRIGTQTRLLGINGAPETSVGYFCAGARATARQCIEGALNETLQETKLGRMQVSVGKHTLSKRVLNEVLFSHRSPAATTRYFISRGTHRTREEQRSSGLWVGPPAGSTAVQLSAGGKVLPLSSKALQFIVREPYLGDIKKPKILRGLIKRAETLRVESLISEGCVYLDGHETEFGVPLGSIIQFERSPEPLRVLGLTPRVTRRNEVR